MGRLTTYLKDRAIVRSTAISKNKGVITNRTAGETLYEDVGDWIPARLRPVTGDENDQDVLVKLPNSHEIVLYPTDVSGDPIVIDESNIIDVCYARNGELSERITGFKIVGNIREIRRNTKVVSFVVPVRRDEEF